MFVRLALTVALLACSLLACPPFASPALADDALWALLKKPGHVVLLRHSNAPGQVQESNDMNFKDCSIQRNLNDSGREQARAMGVAIEKLALARRIVITSPYCRASETADLAFGAHQVNEVLSITPFTGRDTMEAAAVALRSFLTRLPPAGSNYVLITHSLNMVGVGLPDVGEGDSVVIRPDGSNWTVVAQIKADEWKDLR